VVALQALTAYSTDARADVNVAVKITAPGFEKELEVTQENFDVLQIVEVPINQQIEIATTGQGEAIGQVVRRFNLPQVETEQQIMNIDVDYDTTQVEVNDLVNVSVSIEFNPPEPMETGMVIIDISVPTGFAPVTETLDRLLEREARIKRYEIAGRKVIFYIENMFAGDKISFGFQVVALHPVKAKAVSSQAYSYYKPELKGETLGQEIVVR
jgi:CD109 antigen